MLTRRVFAVGMAAAIAGLAAMVAVSVPAARADDKVVVFAAASLKNALDSVNAAWKADTGKEATISYAASSALAKQIEGGAPADIFISADLDWMKYLSDKKPDQAGHRGEAARQHASCWSRPKDSKAEITIAPNFDLAGLLGDGRLAMGDVKAVPAGKYGKAALEVARRLGRGRSQSGASRERARRAEARLDRRGAARHRLPTDASRRARRQGARHFSGRHASADRLSGRPDCRFDECRRRRIPEVSCSRRRPRNCSRHKGSRSWRPSPRIEGFALIDGLAGPHARRMECGPAVHQGRHLGDVCEPAGRHS